MTKMSADKPARAHGAAGSMSRRGFIAALPLFAAGCQTAVTAAPEAPPPAPTVSPAYLAMYAALPEEQFPIPAIDVSQVDPKFLRQQVRYETTEKVGTLVVDTSGPFLYLVQEDGQALRYGIGVGRDGFSWSGRADILMKREWPRWTPPATMIERQPELEVYRNGMEPGLDNPLGARALYLFENGRDTLYRLHGTNEPWSIGQSMSSGCIRLFNQDVIDLYARVPRGSVVLVQEHETSPAA
jgi:lipoprotein-anchoring transpeptidase ErfK/SrfK